jgi:hypothetical protein
MTDNQPRSIADLDPDREVWVADHAKNRTSAHLDANCPGLGDSVSRVSRVLHTSFKLCKRCDPAYDVPKPGSRSSPAWRLRKQGGDE